MQSPATHEITDSPLTDAEVLALKNEYSSDGIRLWLTDQSDLESEFCDPSFLSSLTGEPIAICEGWLNEIAAQNSVPIAEQFTAQRTAHNAELHKAGGSPTNAAVWAELQSKPLKGAKGKFIYNQLKNKVPGGRFTDQTVALHSGYPERAATLKANLQDLLA